MKRSPNHSASIDRRTAMLEAILQTAVDAIITIDQRGRIESANPATERIFGYQCEELIGENISMLMPSPDREQHNSYLDRYLQTRQPRIIGIGREVTGQRKDGSTFPMQLAVSEYEIDGQTFFTGIVRDLSALHVSRRQALNLGRMIEESLNEIYIFDLKTWRFLQVNRGARDNLGYTLDELQAMTPLDIKPKLSRTAFAELLRPLEYGERAKTQFTTVHRRKDGSLYDVEVHLQKSTYEDCPVYVAFIIDITDRIRAEELLRVQQRAIEAAGSGIIITDAKQSDNPVVICNRAFEQITGYEAQEIIGLNCRFLQRDDRDQPAVEHLRHAIQQGRDCHVVIRNYRKDGSMFWNDLKVSPVKDEQGRITHFVGVVTDITEAQRSRDALQETIEEKNERLRHAEAELIKQARLATLGQVFGGIAHEIRNPLNALRTSAYYLQHARQPPAEKVQEHLERIDRQVSVVDNIVTALSDVARLPHPKFHHVPLHDWVIPAVHEVTLPPSVEIQYHLDPELPPVAVDIHQVPIAIKNLVRNARDAMPEGGTLTIAGEASDESVTIFISDTGTGIDDEILPRIMEPLFSTKPRGMGLGLSISRAIIEKNRGRIEVISRPGQGTTFAIAFPRTNPPDHETVTGSDPTTSDSQETDS